MTRTGRSHPAPRRTARRHGRQGGASDPRLITDLKSRGDLAMVVIAHDYAQALAGCERMNILQHGQITFDRASADTSVAELTDLVIAEYRNRRTARRSGQA